MATSEYKNVHKFSRDPERLMAAHQKVISENEARKSIFAYLDEHEVVARFTCKKNGAALGGPHGFIRLPRDGSKRLTLGLTLHEIAHVICHNDRRERGHGKTFVDILDGLIRSEREWDKAE